jgi:PAS domain S-box-containing protein
MLLYDLKFLKDATQPMKEGVVVLDSDFFTILHINPKLERILGYKLDEVFGKAFDFLLGDSGTIYKIYDVLTSDSERQFVVWRMMNKSGEYIEIEFSLTYIQQNNEGQGYILFYIQDRSEIVNLEVKINFTQNLLLAIREVKLAIFLNKSKEEIVNVACESLQKARGFDIVWGLIKQIDKKPQFIFKAKAPQYHSKFSQMERFFYNFPNEIPINQVLENSINSFYFYSNQTDSKYKKWYNTLIESHYMDALCFQISWNGIVYGALELINFSNFPITEDDLNTMQELGTDIGFAFYNQENEQAKAIANKKIEYQGILLDTIEVPIIALDNNGLINYANQHSESILKFSFLEMEKKKAHSFLGFSESKFDFMRSKSYLKEILISNERVKSFSAMLHSSPIIGDYGEFMGIMLVFFDITEQKAQENRIRESESKLRNIFASMNNGIVIVDIEGFIKDVAPILKFHLFQYLNIEENQKIFDFLPDSISKDLYDTIKTCLITQKVERAEFVFNYLGYDTFYSIRFLPLKKYRQTEEAVMLIISDISIAKNLNRQLVESAKFASIGELTAGIAHEINNPLQSALLFLEDLIENDEENRDERNLILKKVEQANLRIKKLISSLLDLGRTETSEKELINIDMILTKAIELIEISAKKKNININKLLLTKNFQIKVRWQEIEQVIINCLMNSINSISEMESPPEFPSIKIILDSIDYMNQTWILIVIEDNGIGIQKQDSDKVFMPLYTTRREKQGTGLGLSISKKIITDHGGEIDFDLNFENGSRLVIKLPLEYKEGIIYE